VRLWRLKGHTENVRALVLSDDGSLCISGSADRTVRVWDVGMRRCIHVFEAHHDSVWALAVAGGSCGYSGTESGAGGMLAEVYSGGRDGLLLSHDLSRMTTGFLVREPTAVQAVAVPASGQELWASAADSHVRRHPTPSGSLAAPPKEPMSSAASWPAPAGDESIVIMGTPRLIDYKILDSKRQVLVRDACSKLSLWDVTSGECFDLPVPPAPNKEEGSEREDDVMKRALVQVNRPVSVPSWFTCDLSLGSLSVYLDVSQCFKAEPDEADTILPKLDGIGAASSAAPLFTRRSDDEVSSGSSNLGTKTLRGLFEGWVRYGNLQDKVSAGGSPGSGRSNSSTDRRRMTNSRPRVFTQPPALLQDGTAGSVIRWEDDKPPGTPADQNGAVGPSGAAASSTPALAGSGFPPATALVLVGRNGSSAGYRGRLYCGYFNGSETPDMLPPWVVDVVWHGRAPPEELCGARTLMFSLARCPSELALPALPVPYCVAAPRTRVRRLMGYLVRVLDFDWSTPAKTGARRPSSAVSLVTRLGRCCVAPASRGRAISSDSWGSQSSDGGEGNQGGRNTPSRWNRGTSRERQSSLGRSHGGSASSASGSARRTLGLRRGEDEAGAGGGMAGRVRIDGAPTPLPSTTAGAPNSSRSAGAAPAGTAATEGPGLPEDHCIEILCNDCLVDPDMSLATVRDFIWKRANAELVLCYRRTNGSSAAGAKEQQASTGASGVSGQAQGSADATLEDLRDASGVAPKE